MSQSTWTCMLAIVVLLFATVTLGHADKNAKAAVTKLESKVAQLLDWNLRRSIISLSSEKFNEYVRNKPRNYSVIAMLTALRPNRQCSVCKEAQDEYKILADSWRYSQDYSSSLFFVMVDIDEDGVDVFQQLQLNSAPTYFHFPSGKSKKEDRYDVGRNGYSADALGKWIAERTSVHITVMRPPNYLLLAIWIPAVLVGTLFVYLKRENLHKFRDSRYWAVAAIIWILAMISGQMWNHIRGPPFAHRTAQGDTGYFSGTSQYQFIAETYIIFVLYGAITVGFVLMNERFAFFDDMGISKVTPIVGLGMVVVVFGYLLSIFRMKYGGYPYSFLFR